MLRATKNALYALGYTSPVVVIDEVRARRNIQRMAAKAARSQVAFRPHVKTHQSTAIGRWFAEAGVDRITVSSPEMAAQFAAAGWNDITVALLLNPREVPALDDLAADGREIGVLVASREAAHALYGSGPFRVWLKVDTGYGRTGIRWDDAPKLRAVAEAVPEHLAVIGLLTHAGHTYQAASHPDIEAIHDETVTRLHSAREAMRASPGCENLLLSLGDTPSCSLAQNFDGIDEIRPGNFVFYDLMQWRLGSCGPEDLAAAVACPVLEIDSDRQRLVLHGGAVHLSKESLADERRGKIYGYLGTLTNDGKSFDQVLVDAPLVSLSQEHGVVQMDAGVFRRVTADLQIGDPVLVWPVHSCLTCDLYAEFSTLEGARLPR